MGEIRGRHRQLQGQAHGLIVQRRTGYPHRLPRPEQSAECCAGQLQGHEQLRSLGGASRSWHADHAGSGGRRAAPDWRGPGNDLGQYGGERLANDPAYRAQVNQSVAVLNACNANPASCTQQAIRAAALVVFPLMGLAGVAITAEGVIAGGTIGSGANVGGQLIANGGNFNQVNPADAGMAAVTGALTYGATLWPSLFINTGGAMVTSAVNNATPSSAAGSISGAAFGTAIGYPVGAILLSGLSNVINPWFRPLWQDMGLTITKWITPSPLPAIGGTIGSSLAQEVGSSAVNNQNPSPNSVSPVRGGQ